ncbi:hypothetical protein H632_c1365p0, partial [Helicosporidium sp. ATCC 50920]
MASALIKQAVEEQVLRAAQEVEDKLDAQLHELDRLEVDDLDVLREKRMRELK